jgi:hypothetical protein
MDRVTTSKGQLRDRLVDTELADKIVDRQGQTYRLSVVRYFWHLTVNEWR